MVSLTVDITTNEIVERLCGLEKLHIKLRRRIRIPVADSAAPGASGRPDEVWSMDFVFDRIRFGTTFKNLGIVDDRTREAVAIVSEHTFSGDYLTRIMDGICLQRGKRLIIGQHGTN